MIHLITHLANMRRHILQYLRFIQFKLFGVDTFSVATSSSEFYFCALDELELAIPHVKYEVRHVEYNICKH